jgi:hypothetical protein
MEDETIQPQDAMFAYRNIEGKPINRELPKMELENMQTSVQKIATEKKNAPSKLLRDSLNSADSIFEPYVDRRIKTKDYVIDQSEVYKTLNDGTLTPMYPDFIKGTDNNERLAQNQSGWEQTINGLSKAGINTGSVVLGNTAGFVYGLADWARTGNFNSVFDNSFSRTLDDWNTKLGYQLPNYYTKDQQNAGFFGGLGSANFWANDVMNGLSFTLGTIASEAIWAAATGGASLAVRLGRAGAKLGQIGRGAKELTSAVMAGETLAGAGKFGKALLGTEKVAEGLAGTKGLVYQALDNAVTTGKLSKTAANVFAKTGEALNTTRFIATSSGNEAGIEAFHLKKEATENFYRDFEKLNGRPPTAEESAEMLDKIEGAANWVFASNMAILGFSNLAMLGNLFNIKSPMGTLQKQVNNKLFGVGVEQVANETGELVYKGIQRKAWQKGAGYLYKGISPLTREGIFEEGLQGVTTKTANNWIERQYDPKYLNKVASLSDDAWKAMGEQYGTKAGWKEIGIGGIVGLIGGIRVAGKSITHEISDFSRLAEEQEKVVAKSLNAANVTMKTFVSDINAGRMMTMAKVMESEDRAEQAMTKRDVVSAKLAHNDSMIALAEMYNNPLYGTGGLEQMERHGNNMIDTTEVSEQEKQELKAGFKSFIGEYKSANNFANSIVGSQGRIYGTKFQASDVQKALTYTILQGQSSKKMMDESLAEIGKFMGKDKEDAMKRDKDLQSLDKETRSNFNQLAKEHQALEARSEALQKKIQLAQISVKGGQESRLPALQREVLEVEKRKLEVNSELEVIAVKIATNKKLESSFGKELKDIPTTDEFISVKDLLEVEKNLTELEESYKTLEAINPVSAQAVRESMSNYQRAQKALLDHNFAIKLIASGNFKPQLADTNPFSGIYKKFAKGEEKADEHTSQFLTRLNEIRESYKNSVMGVGQEKEVEKYKAELAELSKKKKEDLTEDEVKRVQFLIENIAILERDAKSPAKIQAKIDELEKELANIEDDNDPRIEEIDALISELEKELKGTAEQEKNDTPKRKETETPKELTPKEALKARIEDILKLFKTSFVGTYDIDEAVKSRPDQKDIDRYNELLSILEGKTTPEQKEQVESEPRTETEIEVSVPINRIVDSINSSKRFVYNGIIGFIKQDGQQIIFESENGLNIYELGNIDDLQNTSLNEFDIQEEATLQIDLSDDLKTVTIRGKKYTNSYSDPLSAITKTKDGYTVTLENEKGQKRNFRGQIADQIVYELYLKQFEQDATEQDIEQATNDVELQTEVEQPTIIRKKYGVRKAYTKTERKQSREELLEEFQALKEKLSQWRVYDSLAEDEQSVADLLDILAQLETEVEEINTLTEPNIEDTFEELKKTATVDILELSVNTNYPVTVKREANGNYSITHMNPSSLLQRMGATNVTLGTSKKEVSFQEVDDQKKQGIKVNFISGGVPMSFEIKDRGRIEIAEKDFKAIPDVKPIESMTSWSYVPLYEKNFQGKYEKPIASDFSDDNITGDSNELKEDDAVELFIDINNEYNQKLIKEYNKSKAEDKVKTEELENQVVIYIRRKGDKYGKVKGLTVANREEILGSETSIVTLRELAAKALKEGKSGVLATTKVKYVQLGNPILSIDGNGRIAQMPITDKGLEIVEAYGFVQDGEITLNKKVDDVRRSFIKKISEKNKGKKVPIVVIKRGAQMIAFPVHMIKTNDSKVEELYTILDNTEKTDAQKVKAINDLLLQNGIAASEFDLINYDEQKITLIEERLAANQGFKTAEQLIDKNYKKENLKNDVTIALDLENYKVSLPSQKFNIDLENLDYETLPDVKIEKQEVLEKVAEKAVETPIVEAAKAQVNAPKTSSRGTRRHTVEFTIEDFQIKALPKPLADKIKKQKSTNKILDYNEADFVALNKVGVVIRERNAPKKPVESKVANAEEVAQNIVDKITTTEVDEEVIVETTVSEMEVSEEVLDRIAAKIFKSGLSPEEYARIEEDLEEKTAILADLGYINRAIEKLKPKVTVDNNNSKPVKRQTSATINEPIETVNLISFDTTDLAGTATTFYKKGNKWGYIDRSGFFVSLIPRAQAKVESDYQKQKELTKAEKESVC